MTLFFIIIFSLLIGSFISCVSHRLAIGENFVFVRSKCVECGQNLHLKNLIPILSYIFQKGKCSSCGSKISSRYILIEIFVLASYLLIFFLNQSKVDEKLLFLFIFSAILIIISIIDLEHYFIPNSLQILLFSVCFLFIFWQSGFENIFDNFTSAFLFCLFGAFLYGLFYFSANVSAIGIDDIKLLFVAGFILELDSFLLFIFLSGIFGIVFGLLWVFLKKDETFPFAPALCLALFISFEFKESFDLVRFIGKVLF